MDLLTADQTSRSRVINVSSRAHSRAAPLNADDVVLANSSYRPSFIQYPHSKLANVLFTRELARRLGESEVSLDLLAKPEILSLLLSLNLELKSLDF